VESAPVFINGNPDPVVLGDPNACVGENIYLLPNTGGTWESTNEAIATVTDDGIVTGVSHGSVRFIYTSTVSGCVSEESEVITIFNNPVPVVTGEDEICMGSMTTLAPTTGGSWVSNNPTIAAIDNQGFVTAIGYGKATFTFTSTTTGCSSEASDTITVVEGPTVSIGGPNELCIGEDSHLSPSTGGTWSSSDNAVATVTNSGIVTAVGQGSVTFIFTNSETGCVSDPTDPIVVNNAPTVSFQDGDEVCIGSAIQVLPNTGGTWTSDDVTVAMISDEGVVTGISEGSAVLSFVSSGDGCASESQLTVTVLTPSVVGITGPNEICIGSFTTLSADATGLWTSDNPNIATVTNAGVVTGVAPGKTTFTFTNLDGCSIGSVTEAVTVASCLVDDANVITKDTEVNSSIFTNDNVPVGTTYGGYSVVSKPTGSLTDFTINADGTYTFEGSKAGKDTFEVFVCIPPSSLGCATTLLEITVLDNIYGHDNPAVNLDMARTYADEPVVLNSMENDMCVKVAGCNLDFTTSTVMATPNHGNAVADALGQITYTPDPGFVGIDTIHYEVCTDASMTSCAQSMQLITVNHNSAENTVYAADDFGWTMKDTETSGNVMGNDGDGEGDVYSITPQGTMASPVVTAEGSYYIESDGTYSFTPADGFFGYTEIVYTVCDDNVEVECTDATLHLLVFDDLKLNLKVYLEGALMNNGNEISSDGWPLMRDDLRVNPYDGNNYIPLEDPYTFAYGSIDLTSKFIKVGPGLLPENQVITDSVGVFGVEGDNAIVDWVFVEVRDKADNLVTLGTRSGLVQRDGDVVDLDGVSPLRFKGIAADSFYVVVNHRLHLGAMSMLVANNDVVDFRALDTEVFTFGDSGNSEFDYTGLSTNLLVKPGYSALWGGDFDGNGLVKFDNPNDDKNLNFYNIITHPENDLGASNFDFAYGYYCSDYDMNGKTKFDNPDDDTNLLLFQMLTYELNPLGFSNFAGFKEQVPRSQ